ncbi:MAG: hypothetical protein R3B53_00125 [Candidatus Paceibacterota bacterium]
MGKARGSYVADFRVDLDHLVKGLSDVVKRYCTGYSEKKRSAQIWNVYEKLVIAEVIVEGEAGLAETMTVSLIASQQRLVPLFERFAPDKVDRVVVKIVSHFDQDRPQR